MERIFDVAVIGGGLVGKAAAIAAARRGLDVVHLAPEGRPDARTSALMNPAVAFLASHTYFARPSEIGTPLAELRIIDATGRFFRAPEVYFRASEAGLEAFGWNFANLKLGAAMDRQASSLTTLTRVAAPLNAAERRDELWHLALEEDVVIRARLLVGADGKGSKVRETLRLTAHGVDYVQSALVCDLLLERPIGACSVEFHYPQGPFTLVPAGGDRANLVWIDRAETLEAARADQTGFPPALAERSQRLFGTITVKTPPVVFPLSHLSVSEAGRDGAVLVGEAAHAFPPIGAQGLNLGLRDVAALDAILAQAPRGTGWADRVARRYAREQTPDMAQTGLFVRTLFSSLVSDALPAQALRSTGLWALTTVPALRKSAFAFGMGRR